MFQTNIGDPLCLETEVGNRRCHAPQKKNAPKSHEIKKFIEKWHTVFGQS